MNILYITRWNVPILKEHVFIKDVWDELYKYKGSQILEIIVKDREYSQLTYSQDNKIWRLEIPQSIQFIHERITKELYKAFYQISPDIIHSNMQEGYELEAANLLHIPVLTTIHIGSVICPRGGNGLWTSRDTICDGKIGEKCIKCCCDELPFSTISNIILKILPIRLKSELNIFFNKHKTFYFTRLFNIEKGICERIHYLKTLTKAYPIAANSQLYELLKFYGCHPILIPHGAKERTKIPFPSVNKKIKFYYIGRITYQKGLHIAIEAFKNIDQSLYEFHIIGYPNNGRKNKIYFQRILHKLKSINSFYHGYVSNDMIDNLIKDWHVMIHTTICHEIYGLTISESLALGRPVLASKCYGSEMQIQNGVNGWLVPPNDAKALRKVIQDIISNKSHLPILSNNCKIPHTMTDYIDRLIKTYNNVLTIYNKKDNINIK